MILLKQKQFSSNQLLKLRTCKFKLTNLQVLKRLAQLNVITLHRNTGKEIWDDVRKCATKARYVEFANNFYVEDIGFFTYTYGDDYHVYVERSKPTIEGLQYALATKREWADENVLVENGKFYFSHKGKRELMLETICYVRPKSEIVLIFTDAMLRMEASNVTLPKALQVLREEAISLGTADISPEPAEHNDIVEMLTWQVTDGMARRLEYVDSIHFYGADNAIELALHKTRYEDHFKFDSHDIRRK